MRRSRRGQPAVEELVDDEAREAWFLDHGLPWFVREVDERVAALLAPRRLVPVIGGILLISVVAGRQAWSTNDPSSGFSAAIATSLSLGLAYAAGPMRLGIMSRWAARQAFAQIGLMLPVALRALPLLLLFTTFLFINTEVWQVAGALSVTRLWAAVLVFTVLGTMFLLTRLPEEVRRVEQAMADSGSDQAELGRMERVNLLLVLLVLQTIQVLLLAMTMFGFFIGFGVLAIGSDVIESWVGHLPSLQIWDEVGLPIPISGELAKVSTFLAAFSALYFTIYAVSDPTYRQQFFAHIDRELERAVGVRAAYRMADSVGDQHH